MASKGTGKGKAIAGKSPANDVGASSSSGKRNKSTGGSTSAAERRKRRRSAALQFFDDAAFEAGSESEEEGDKQGLDLEPEKPYLDSCKLDNKASQEVGKSHLLPVLIKEEELDQDEFEELIKERYGRNSEYVTFNEDIKEFDSKVETDPTEGAVIWRVKCMVGREHQLAFCFMQKYVDLNDLGTSLQIQSVFALEHIKGYVFVEAEKQSDVIEACRGFCSVYASGIKLVSSSEFPLLLASQNKPLEVPLGSWVRMRNGNYKGDLAQVVAVDDGQKAIMVKLVPRVDLQAIAKKFGGGISLKLASVPAPRLISSYELEKFRPHIEVRRDRMTGEHYEILDGMMLKDGYLFKRVSSASLIYSGVQPSPDEILKFSESSKAEDEDLNWISSVYHGNKKPRFAEISEPTSKKSSFNVHELVLFRRKDYGVIIAEEKDYFKILKGDVEGTEVVPVKMQDIKKSCVDRMFTAVDCKRKSISINDAVKVLEGPLQGREGVVKHMYKGTLFVRDENVSENGGFFCVKSNSCEKAIKFKETFGKNMENNHNPLFSQSTMVTDNQQDDARGSSWRCQSYGDQAFHVGQTLRIRKGPLKGYLCRVIGIYRSDITVKLDSLVKIITVQDKFLSDPNVKRDHSTFGTEEKLFTGGFAFGETENQAEKRAWDDGGPSLDSRDSWQPFTTPNIPSASNTENQTVQACKVDPWSNRLTSTTMHDADGSDKTMGGWGGSISSSDQVPEDDPWGSKLIPVTRADACPSDRVADGWGGSVPTADEGCEVDPWGSKLASAAMSDAGVSDEPKNNWGGTTATTGPKDDPWGSKLTSSDRVNAARSTKDTDSWDNSVGEKAIGTKVETSGAAADGWNSKVSVNHNTDANHWERSTVPDGVTGGSWDANLKNESCKDTSESRIAQWNTPSSDVQLSSAENSGGSGGWDTIMSNNDKEQVANRGKAGSSWNDRGKKVISGEGDAWGRPDVNDETKAISWEKRTSFSAQSDGWSKGGWKGKAESYGWDKGNTVPSQNDEWANAKSPHGTSDSGWNKREQCAVDDQDSWNRPRNFEGSGGRGRGRGRGFGWGKQSENSNEDDGGRDQESNWGQHKRFNGDGDGDGGGRRGRGRGGRFGRGRDQEDNWSGPRRQEGSWESVRGGRGRGRATWNRSWESNEEALKFAGGITSGWGYTPSTAGGSDKGMDVRSKFAADKATSNEDEISQAKTGGQGCWATTEAKKDKGASWVQTGSSMHSKNDKLCSWDEGKQVVNTEDAWSRPAANIELKLTSWDTENVDIVQSDGGSSVWDTVGVNKDKEQDGVWGQRGDSTHPKDDKSRSWEDKGKKIVNEEDPWSRSVANVDSQPTSWDSKGGTAQPDGWGSGGGTAGSSKGKGQGSGWGQIGNSTHPRVDESLSWDDKENIAINTVEDNWCRPSADIESKPSSWDTKKGGSPRLDDWRSVSGTAVTNRDERQGAGWDHVGASTDAKVDESSTWDNKGNKQVTASEDERSRPAVHSQPNNWDTKNDGTTQLDGWGKAGWKGEAEGGWSKGRFTSNQNEQYVGNQQDSWSRSRNYEGTGGRGRGRECGFGWGKQGDNENEGSQGSTWGRFEDEGGRRVRGRGGYFGREGRGREDNWSGAKHQEGGWASRQGGRGRARMLSGEAASDWRQGSSRNKPFDWKNQEIHEDFSDPSRDGQSKVWNSSQENNQQEPSVADGSKSSWDKW